MEIARPFVAAFEKRQRSYMALQCCLMEHFFAMGGSMEEWNERLAPLFRERYGWMVEDDQPAENADPRVSKGVDKFLDKHPTFRPRSR